MNMLARNWRDLIRPRGIQVEHETLTEFYGKFTCEPLERGYGITLATRSVAFSSRRSRARPPRPCASTARCTSSPASVTWWKMSPTSSST